MNYFRKIRIQEEGKENAYMFASDINNKETREGKRRKLGKRRRKKESKSGKGKKGEEKERGKLRSLFAFSFLRRFLFVSFWESSFRQTAAFWRRAQPTIALFYLK